MFASGQRAVCVRAMRPPLLLAMWRRMRPTRRPLSHLSRAAAAEPRRAALELLARRALCDDAAGRRVVFSGIQPTGTLHLGNYLGAVEAWLRLQQDADSQLLLSVVDLHALSRGAVEPAKLRADVLAMGASLLACGVDPRRCILFQQSRVGEHAQLAWILGCMTTTAQLSRLQQYRERAATYVEGNVPLGVLTYPALQAADILLYRATHVPVGEDQRQNISIAQKLARYVNNFYNEDVFPVPQMMCCAVARVKSLRKPTSKMSKSADDALGRLDLLDSDDAVRAKVMRAVTDDCSRRVTYEPERRPGVSNLVTIHSAISGLSIERICEQTADVETGHYKPLVADAVIEWLRPIRDKLAYYQSRPDLVAQVLRDGSAQAAEIASSNLAHFRTVFGLD